MNTSPKRSPTAQPLTFQELRTVQFLAEGLSYHNIARAMGLSVETVRGHLKRAGAKVPGDLPVRPRLIQWYQGRRPFYYPTEPADQAAR